MRFLPVIAVGLVAASTVAQTTQFLEIHPGQTSFTSRGNLGTGAGELLMGLHTSHWRGVGDNGTACEAASFRVVVQDQNSATQENYNIVVRLGTDVNGPTTGTGPELLLQAGPVNMPSTPTGSINAWLITSTLTSPLAIPCDDHVSWGIEATNSPDWTMDGMSLHTAFGSGTRPFNYRNPNGDDMAWQIDAGSTAASNASNLRTWRVAIGTTANIMQLGANSTTTPATFRYGTAGMFPEPGQGLSVRVQGNGTANTQSVPMLAGVGIAGGPIGLFGGVGRLWITPFPGLILPIGASDAAGDLTLEPLAPALPTGSFPPVFFQAAYLGGTGDMTNANATQILP